MPISSAQSGEKGSGAAGAGWTLPAGGAASGATGVSGMVRVSGG